MPEDATVAIALLSPTDVDAYRQVRLRALAEHPEAFRSDAAEEAARPLQWWRDRLAPRAASGAAILGAWKAPHGLVGTAGLLFDTRRKVRHTVTLVGMYVMPEHAGRGIAARLLSACIDVARADAELEFVYLTVTSTNAAAIRLYERTGFVTYGEEPGSMRIGDRRFDKRLMALRLR